MNKEHTEKKHRRSKAYIMKRSRYNVPIKNLSDRKAKLLNNKKSTEHTNDNIPDAATHIRSGQKMRMVKIKMHIKHKKLSSRKSQMITEDEAQEVLFRLTYGIHTHIGSRQE